jgi:hypothetical protein
VELVDLVFEYWLDSGASPRLARDKVLEVVPGRIDASNVYDLISLLAKRGVADEFFGLLLASVDTDGRLRGFLLANGVLPDTIRYYATWDAIDPKLFVDGFFFGIGESFATVVIDLAKLAKLASQLQQAQLRALVLLVTDPSVGAAEVQTQIGIVGQIFDALVAQLNPADLPAHVVQTWRNWNAEFEKHLENLDPFSAGRVLGKIGGDLWQLLTGIVALVKLLRIGARLALRYAPLLIGTIRKLAAEAALVVREFIALYQALGKIILDGVAKVGMEVLRTLFPPGVLKALVKDGRALLTSGELTMVPMLTPAYAGAFNGMGMGTRFGVLVCNDGRPILMAAVSETIPSAGRAATPGELNTALDEILERLDDLMREPGKAPKPNPTAAEVKAARIALLRQRLDQQIRALLQKIAYESFTDLRRLKGPKGRIFADELGRLIHARMTGPVAALIGETSPTLKVFTERELRTIARTLMAAEPDLATGMRGAEQALGQTIAQMLLRHPDSARLLDLLGVDTAAAARTEEALTSFLSKQFRWKATTTVGDLTSDLVMIDADTASAVNLDWTSSTKLDKFEKVWGQVVEDLGGKFDGNWDKLAEAYNKAARGAVPAEVANGLEALTRHAVRETIIRQAALHSVFGEMWNIRSYEMTYDGLAKLFRLKPP